MSALPLTCFALILTELVHEHSVYVYHKLIYVRACDGTPACRVDGPQSWLTELLACLLAMGRPRARLGSLPEKLTPDPEIFGIVSSRPHSKHSKS